MVNLRYRIRKAEDAHKVLTGGDVAPVFFWRDDPKVQGEQENRFREENPDFKGEIYIYYVGTANLTPSV